MPKMCLECGKPVILKPTAAERSEATGLPARHFEELFPMHVDCQLAKRKRDTEALIHKHYLRKDGSTGWLVVSHIGD
jgi:hypothetical protein